MMEWNDVSKSPEKEGKILVNIDGAIFCINVYVIRDYGFMTMEEMYCKVIEDISCRPCEESNMLHEWVKTYKATWIVPKHFKRITHWCEIPPPPKVKDD